MPMPKSNLLLDMLPAQARDSVLALLHPVSLPVGTVLYEAEEAPLHVHFMTSGMASIVTSMEDGNTAEVGVVGREGMPESMHLLGTAEVPTRCFMQVGGSGLRMDFRGFEQMFLRDEGVRRPLLRFVQYQTLMLSQLAACNRLHEVEARLARWMLMVEDRVGEPTLRLTQEFLSQMLGARRSTVTVVAGAFQRDGLIEYRRGEVTILDREGLERTACECYAVTQRLFRRFADPTDPRRLDLRTEMIGAD